MENGQLKTVYHPVGALIFAEYNPRQLTKDQYKSLRDSMERFGLVDPVIINKHPDRENIVIGGHQRLRIAKDMGIEKVPCVELSLDLNQEKELNVRLNRNVGEWDYDALANYFDVGELTEWGFTEDELQFWMDEPTEGLIEDDEIPEVEEAVTQAGDLWLLGEHRVLCGDATKKEDVERLMEGQKADMVFTDPPYGVMYKSSKSNAISGDLSQATIPLSFKEIIHSAASKDARIYICGGSNNAQMYFSLFDSYCQQMPKILVWVKETFVMRPNNYHSQYEFIYFGWTGKGGSTKYWYGDRKQSDVWQFNRDNSKDYLHPTQKPTVLAETAIGYSCPQSGIVYEPFLGSGSTLIACEKAGRKCYGMEIDPHYCDVIVKRWEEFTGKEALRMESARC